MSNFTLPTAVNISADRQTLTEYAKSLSLKIGKNDDERAIAAAIIDHTNKFTDAQWEKMVVDNEQLGYFINDINTQIRELPAEEKQPESPSSEETAGDAMAVLEADINSAKTKKDVEKKSAELAKEFGLEVSFLKKDTMAVMKEKLIGALKAKLAPEPKKKAPPARVKADASVPDPTAAAVSARKNAAAATAAVNQKKSPRGAKEGEPYREGTSSYVMWKIIKTSRKRRIPYDEIVAKAEEMIKNEKISCTNVPNRVKTITNQMKRRGFVISDDDGFAVNPDLDK
jgi:hypothetical protein